MQQENEEVKETILTVLVKNGPLGIALAVIIWLHIDGTNMHREERNQWRDDIREMTDDFSATSEKNGEAIKELLIAIKEKE